MLLPFLHFPAFCCFGTLHNLYNFLLFILAPLLIIYKVCLIYISYIHFFVKNADVYYFFIFFKKYADVMQILYFLLYLHILACMQNIQMYKKVFKCPKLWAFQTFSCFRKLFISPLLASFFEAYLGLMGFAYLFLFVLL